MNGMQTKHDRREAVASLYDAASGDKTPRDITFDGEGVAALVGQQGTNELWYAERVAVDDGEMTFRVLLINPSKSKGFRMNRRTGQPEFDERLTSCQYFVGDVTVAHINSRASLGTALRRIQERFRVVQRDGGLERGQVRNRRDLVRVYDKWFDGL